MNLDPSDFEIDERLAPLRKVGDLVSLVLTAHLITEAQIVRLLEARCRSPESLEKARLTFKQRLSVLQALAPIDEQTAEAVEALNRIRNHLLHNLKRRPYAELMHEFSSLVANRLPMELKQKASDEVALFIQCVVYTIGVLEGFRVVDRILGPSPGSPPTKRH